jgi:hypothetical protein
MRGAEAAIIKGRNEFYLPIQSEEIKLKFGQKRKNKHAR